MIKDRRSSHQGCFDDGSRSLELGSKIDAACIPEDCRRDRRRVRPASEPRISGLGARNDWRVVQEAPEPTGFWLTANVGVRYPVRARENQFSWRPILFSAHEDRGTVCRFRSRREHRKR